MFRGGLSLWNHLHEDVLDSWVNLGVRGSLETISDVLLMFEQEELYILKGLIWKKQSWVTTTKHTQSMDLCYNMAGFIF